MDPISETHSVQAAGDRAAHDLRKEEERTDSVGARFKNPEPMSRMEER